MSEPYFNFPSEISCPFCGEQGQCLEDLGDNPFHLSADCGSCEKSFAYNPGSCEFYDNMGNTIKAVEKKQ